MLRHLYDTGVHVRVSADVGQVDLGSRALFNAAARGHDPVVRMLVSWGVDTSATDQVCKPGLVTNSIIFC